MRTPFSAKKQGTGYRMKQVVQGSARLDCLQVLVCHGTHICGCARSSQVSAWLCVCNTRTHTLTPTYIHVKGLCMYVCTYKYIYLMSLPTSYIWRPVHCSHTQYVTPAGGRGPRSPTRPSACASPKGSPCPPRLGGGRAPPGSGSRPGDPPGHCRHRSCSSCSDCPQGSAPFPAGAAGAGTAAAAGSLRGSFDPGEVKSVLT